ncbi:hypothetical protein Mal64_33750 [Pseudobythopirellula maris]|uniref:CNNM transmembrane domain-containing protein n=1 Tax=Pseudobythopirellula maris TaxID=2527991 RepID=A0A5C5ZGK4_9BACT|nr:CNNM domain-containing protein [Pseudobythopirellula maris]TWT86549.1 hypothetical protein Mal64_33750 [Pseudobythopirellula maris]
MLLALLLFFVGLMLSAFFSGSETGFYRAPRLRMVIDSLAGDRVAKRLLWAANRPTLFVATSLVGNNVANYLVSLAVVIAASVWFPGSEAAGVLVPIAFTPIVFICGELLPKNAFLDAPYRLLRKCVPGLMIAGFLFAPISALLWLVGRTLEWIGNAPVAKLRVALARREIEGVFDEGHAIGLLASAQKDLALATFSLARRPLKEFILPVAKEPIARADMSRRAVLRLARQRRLDELPVVNADSPLEPIGKVRVLDCALAPGADGLPVLPLPVLRDTDSALRAITRLQTDDETLAQARDASGKLLGYVRLENLYAELLAGE